MVDTLTAALVHWRPESRAFALEFISQGHDLFTQRIIKLSDQLARPAFLGLMIHVQLLSLGIYRGANSLSRPFLLVQLPTLVEH